MVEERRIVPIHQKVFTLGDLRELSGIVFEQYNTSIKNGTPESKFSIDILCNKNMQYYSEGMNMLDVSSPVAKRFINKLECTFSNTHKYLALVIEHDKEAYLKVGSDDSVWANAMEGQLIQALSDIKNQYNPIRKYTVALCITAFAAGVMLSIYTHDLMNLGDKNILSFWPRTLQYLNKGNYWEFSRKIFQITFGGIMISGLTYLTVLSTTNIWPDIEIDAGPDFMNKLKRKRNRMIVIYSMIVIPVLVSVLTEIFI